MGLGSKETTLFAPFLIVIKPRRNENRGIPRMDQVTSQLLPYHPPPAQGGGGVGPAGGIPIFGWDGNHRHG